MIAARRLVHGSAFGALCLLALAAGSGVARAELPSFLRSENSRVREGNEKLRKGDAKGALEAYELAARTLPKEAGVQLNRGLALISLGELQKAREALLAATEPSAPAELRADAYRNLALAFYREADALAQSEQHAEAQKLFREAVDASKRALRLRPSDPDAAWNLELAARRLREEEAKQKQKEQEEREKRDEDAKPQDGGDPKDRSKDEDKGDRDDSKGKNEQGQNDPGEAPEEGDGQSPQPRGKDGDQDQSAQPQPPAEPNEQKGESSRPNERGEPKPDAADPRANPLPAEVEQALSALQEGEENFERFKARRRAARERRAPEKDW